MPSWTDLKRAILLAALMAAAVLAAGAQVAGALRIAGRVEPKFSLTGDFADTTLLDLVNGSSASLGTLKVDAKNVVSWRITIVSSGNGRLVGDTAGNPDRYPYSMDVGPLRGISLENGFTFVTGPVADGFSLPLSITWTPIDRLDILPAADTYRDRIVITITSI